MSTTYIFLQHYWWFIVSLLGSLLVFLLFVQGGNSMILNVPSNEVQRKMMINSTGRKWEFTFTTLVTFGGAFFASFPLFYSTSFGGAYWLWMIILFSFVLQAVSYEFQSKAGNLLGQKTYRLFLFLNGIIGPVCLGMAVATFFTGSEFVISKDNMLTGSMGVISQWTNELHGLEALGDYRNWLLGLAVLFLSRLLASMYFINNISDESLVKRIKKSMMVDIPLFLVFFLSFITVLFLMPGYAVDPGNGYVYMENYKYFNNFIDMPWVLLTFIVGVVFVLAGLLLTLFKPGYRKGIWFSGIGTVLTVLALFLCAGYNNTAYYPSTSDLQSSLTISNSCSSEFTLRVMQIVSYFIPFVLAYIYYAWRSIDRKSITEEEMRGDGHIY